MSVGAVLISVTDTEANYSLLEALTGEPIDGQRAS